MSSSQISLALAVALAVVLLLYVWRPWRYVCRYDWTILNGYGPGQFKTPYPMTVYGAAHYAGVVGWSVVNIDHKRKVLLVKKRA